MFFYTACDYLGSWQLISKLSPLLEIIKVIVVKVWVFEFPSRKKNLSPYLSSSIVAVCMKLHRKIGMNDNLWLLLNYNPVISSYRLDNCWRRMTKAMLLQRVEILMGQRDFWSWRISLLNALIFISWILQLKALWRYSSSLPVCWLDYISNLKHKLIDYFIW